MMHKLTDDPAFWAWLWTFVGLLFTASGALLGLLIAWAKARTAEYEARSAKGTADSAIAGQGLQQATLVQHGEAIAALQATSPGVSAPMLPAPPAPVLTVPPMPPAPTPPVPSGVTVSSVQSPSVQADSGAGPSLTPPAAGLP